MRQLRRDGFRRQRDEAFVENEETLKSKIKKPKV